MRSKKIYTKIPGKLISKLRSSGRQERSGERVKDALFSRQYRPQDFDPANEGIEARFHEIGLRTDVWVENHGTVLTDGVIEPTGQIGGSWFAVAGEREPVFADFASVFAVAPRHPGSDPQHGIVETALTRLAGQSTLPHYTHQNIAQFWNAVTRPVSMRGSPQ